MQNSVTTRCVSRLRGSGDLRAARERSSAHLAHPGVGIRHARLFVPERSRLTRRAQTQFGDSEGKGGGRRRVAQRGQGRGKRGGGEAQSAAMSSKQLGKTIRCVANAACADVP